MKKTLNVNIGSIAFVIEEDAYNILRRYLDDIGSRFEPGEREETLSDVEMRIADIFSDELSSSRKVVNTDLVRKAISIIGKAEDFGEPRHRTRQQQERARNDVRRFRRSRSDRVIAGVCGGIADYFGIDVTLVRLLMFIFVFFGFLSGWIYIILWLIVPLEDEDTSNADGNFNR